MTNIIKINATTRFFIALIAGIVVGLLLFNQFGKKTVEKPVFVSVKDQQKPVEKVQKQTDFKIDSMLSIVNKLVTDNKSITKSLKFYQAENTRLGNLALAAIKNEKILNGSALPIGTYQSELPISSDETIIEGQDAKQNIEYVQDLFANALKADSVCNEQVDNLNKQLSEHKKISGQKDSLNFAIRKALDISFAEQALRDDEISRLNRKAKFTSAGKWIWKFIAAVGWVLVLKTALN